VLGASEPTHASTPSVETQVGTVLGTPGYMAPEQVKDSKVGPAADVYSLGKILLDILAKRSDVAPELDAICTAARADDPAARPTTRALADAVQAYLDGDRDLERRRQLAAEQIAVAQRAREAGKRSDAIRAAGRALALDPNALDAGELLTGMIVEVPEVTPPEVESSIAAVEQRITRERSRQSMFAYLAIWLTVPFLVRTHVASWPLLVALFAVANLVVAMHWINYRTTRVATWMFVAVNLVLVVLFAQWVGALQLSPLFVSALMVALATRPDLARRPVFLLGFGAVGVFLPIALELTGVLDRTFSFGAAGLTSWGNIIDSRTTLDLVLAIGGAVALVMLTGRFAMGMTRARLDAQRQMHIQAWQLRQLLPRPRSERSE
jgi:serine/threonine-protein kinase